MGFNKPRPKKFCDLVLYVYIHIVHLKYAHLSPFFRLHNINFVFSTCPHKYKYILSNEKPVLKTSFQDY